MDILKEFLSEYGFMLIYAVLAAVAGWLGAELKKLYAKLIDTREKKDIVETCVKAAEQIYFDLHGKEKFDAMCADAAQLATAKGISVTDIEIRMLAEAALCEFNRRFDEEG